MVFFPAKKAQDVCRGEVGGGGVNIVDAIFLFAMQSHHVPRIVTVLVHHLPKT